MTVAAAPSGSAQGILVVDKPAGWTSHDVVARIRRIAGTRRVGHAGTLDPMATGVLIIGIGRGTRLLGHLAGQDKAYDATIRLGWGTHTDDAQGERTAGAAAHELSRDVVQAAVEKLTGPILQRPASVSAIKVAGRRAHARVRAGEQVELTARPVVVESFEVLDHRPAPEVGALDLDIQVVVSSGTYVRALARDLGEALGVGGHLSSLRRTRSGAFELDRARSVAELAESGSLDAMGLAQAARMALPFLVVQGDGAVAIRHGQRVAAPPDVPLGVTHALLDGPGELLALAQVDPDGAWRYQAVLGPV